MKRFPQVPLSQLCRWGLACLIGGMISLAGCDQGALNSESGSGDNASITVGDDTYVPSFGAGDLRFTKVWVKDVAESGFPTDIWFDVTNSGEELRSDITVHLDFKRLENQSLHSLNLASKEYQPDYLGTYVELPYLEAGETRHTEHTFRIPADVEEGVYAAIFTVRYKEGALNNEKVIRQLQAAPGTILIGKPDYPNIRILDYQLAHGNSLVFQDHPAPSEGEVYTPKDSQLALMLGLESMAMSTSEPIEVTFDLKVPGYGTFPVLIQADASPTQISQEAMIKESNPKVVIRRWVKQPECKIYDRSGVITHHGIDAISQESQQKLLDQGRSVRCASLFRESTNGLSFNLELTPKIQEVLKNFTVDTPVELIVNVDPDQKITEWRSSKLDNQVSIPLMFLADPYLSEVTSRSLVQRSSAAETPYPKDIYALWGSKSWNLKSEWALDPGDLWRGDNNVSVSEDAGHTLPKEVFTSKYKDFRKSPAMFGIAFDFADQKYYRESSEFKPYADAAYRKLSAYLHADYQWERYYLIDFESTFNVDLKNMSNSFHGYRFMMEKKPIPIEDMPGFDDIQVLNLDRDSEEDVDEGKKSEVEEEVIDEKEEKDGKGDATGFVSDIVRTSIYYKMPQFDDFWVTPDETISNHPSGDTAKCDLDSQLNAGATLDSSGTVSSADAPQATSETYIQQKIDELGIDATPEELAKWELEIKDFRSYVWEETNPGESDNCYYYPLFDSLSKDTNMERFTVWESWVKEKSFQLGPIPMGVEAGIAGETGAYAKLNLYPNNQLIGEQGPYINVNGMFAFYIGNSWGKFTAQIGLRATVKFIKYRLANVDEMQFAPSLGLTSFTHALYNKYKALYIKVDAFLKLILELFLFKIGLDSSWELFNYVGFGKKVSIEGCALNFGGSCLIPIRLTYIDYERNEIRNNSKVF